MGAAVVVAVCEKILVDDPYHLAVAYAAFYVLFLSVSFCFLSCTLCHVACCSYQKSCVHHNLGFLWLPLTLCVLLTTFASLAVALQR